MHQYSWTIVLAITFLAATSLVTSESHLDSDNDGLSDWQELFYSTDPANPDTDNDGLLDGKELQAGTNPLDQDTDHDMLTDKEESEVTFTDPLLSDSDEDGFKDGEEVMAGTNPLDKNSIPSQARPVVEEIPVNKEELAIMRAELIGKEVPIQSAEKLEEKKYTPEELQKIQAAYNSEKQELKINIQNKAKLAASKESFFIDFDSQ